jgi:predicted CopG family antitoxin
MSKTIKISDKAYEILNSTGKSMPEAVDDLVTKSNQTPVQVVTSGNPDSGSASDTLDTVRRIEARIKGQDEINKKILDRTAKLEEVYIELLAKFHGGK